MKKFEHLGKSLNKQEQKKIKGGYDGGCLEEYSCDCGYPPSKPCCTGSRCEANATMSGTICVPF